MIIQIHVPIYRCSVLCFCNSTLEEFDEFYYKNVKGFTNKEYEDVRNYIKNDKSSYAWTQHLETTDIMIWFTRPRVDMDVVHEFYHATHMILVERGIYHDDEKGTGDEPFAYLLGYLVNEYYVTLDNMENENKTEKTL